MSDVKKYRILSIEAEKLLIKELSSFCEIKLDPENLPKNIRHGKGGQNTKNVI